MRERVQLLGAAVVLVAAIAVDVVRPPAPVASRGVVAATTGGVLACPNVLPSRGSAYLHIANPGMRTAGIRVTLVPSVGRPVEIPLEIGPTRVRALKISGRVKAPAAAVLEYFGSDVVASHTLWIPRVGTRGGGAGAPCERAASGEVVVASLRTFAATSSVSVFNPGSASADISVSFLADGRRLNPQRLSRRVIPSRSRLDINVGDYAFEARGVTAIISASAGRVVAEGKVSSLRGFEIVSGRPAEPGGAVIAARSGSGVVATVAPVGVEDSAVAMRIVDGARQGVLPGAPSTLRAGTSRRIAVPEAMSSRAAALVVDVAIGSPVAAGVSWDWAGSPSDEVITPLVVAGTGWNAVGGSPYPASTIVAFVLNVSDKPANVRLDVYGTRTEHIQREIGPGRIGVQALSRVAGTFGVKVSSDQPVAVVLQVAGRAADGSMLAFGMPASPVIRARPVAASADSRVGIPARIPAV